MNEMGLKLDEILEGLHDYSTREAGERKHDGWLTHDEAKSAILTLLKEMVPEEDSQGWGTATVSPQKTWNQCIESMLSRIEEMRGGEL